jgi:hypothetical protein
VLLGFLVLALSACGSGDGDSGSPSSGATPTNSETFEFTGYLVRSQGETRICEMLAESHPPQCGGTRYRVVGLDVTGAQLEEAQGVSWSEGPMTLRGVLVDDGKTLMVSPNPALGGGPPPPTVQGQPGSAPG